MNKFLFNFNYKRSILEAIAFYILCIIIFTALAEISIGIISLISPKDHSAVIGQFSAISGMVISLLLSGIVLNAKGLSKNPLYILLAALSLILGFVSGALLSFIPTALLTMITPLNQNK